MERQGESRDLCPTGASLRAIFAALAALLATAAFSPGGARAGGGLGLGSGHWLGTPFQVDNLTVFPVYASDQPDVGSFITLEQALKNGTAEVREQSGGQVNTLVIQNNGGTTILVLAGTVVVGGKQDRQVGQDFVIPPKKTVPIDAFCVEHGRWDANRGGRATGGKFGSAGVLANRSVRAAGQYKGDQSEVWAEVSQVNAENSKSASTGTLMATLGDAEVAKKREDMKDRIQGYLSDVADKKKIVGLAYAVDGQVRGARWFLTHQIYLQFEATLINTMAVEAITAQAAAKAAGKPISTKKAEGEEVQQFVDGLRKSSVKEKKKTKAANENQYRETDEGYSSDCLIEEGGKAMPVTTDFLSK